MGMRAIPAAFEAIPDEDIDRADEVLASHMRKGSKKLLYAIHKARGTRPPCKHGTGSAGLCHQCGDEKREAEKHVPNLKRERAVLANLNRTNSKPWPTWYNPHKPFFAGTMIAGVARDFGLTKEEMIGGSRRRANVRARMVAATILRKRGWSYPQIARVLGWYDHSTALYSVSMFETHSKYDSDLVDIFERNGGIV